MSKKLAFVCDNCCKETERTEFSDITKMDVPLNWISLSVKAIENRIEGSAMTIANDANLHYCSRHCFQRAFFLDEPCTSINENK